MTTQVDMTVEELKSALDMMGVKYHHNAKEDTLKKLFIEAKGEPEVKEEEEGIDPKAHLIMKRYKIACMNPIKRDWKGEIFTAGNDRVGTVRKFIPYNCPAAEAWHIPAFLVEAIQDRKYLQTSLEKDHKGRDFIRKSWAKEFVLTELPPLSAQEMAQLARHQMLVATTQGSAE